MKRLCIVLAAVSLFALVGCSSGDVTGDLSADNLFGSETIASEEPTTQAPTTTTTAEVTEKETEKEIEEIFTIGVEEGSTASMKITNGSGKTITDIFIKENGTDGYDGNDLMTGAFADGETLDAFFDVDAEKKYDLKIVFEDGEEVEIEKLYLGYIPEGTILLAEGEAELEHEPLDIEVEPTETTKKKKSNPNNGCIGDDGMLY